MGYQNGRNLKKGMDMHEVDHTKEPKSNRHEVIISNPAAVDILDVQNCKENA